MASNERTFTPSHKKFDEKLYLKRQEKLCLLRARHGSVLEDGDTLIKDIPQGFEIIATYKLD